MAFLLRFLGLDEDSAPTSEESGVVRRIAERLERLEPEAARHLAAFAYVLARVANADLEIRLRWSVIPRGRWMCLVGVPDIGIFRQSWRRPGRGTREA